MAESLDDLINAIQHAVIEAQEIAEDHHIDLVGRFFEEDEGTGKTRAVTQDVWVPSPGGEDIMIKVPLMTLASLGAMKIKELKVEFEAKLSSLDTDEADEPQERESKPQKKAERAPLAQRARKGAFSQKIGRRRGRRMALDFKRGAAPADDATVAKISITFEGTEPPEGVIRLNNQVLKTIP